MNDAANMGQMSVSGTRLGASLFWLNERQPTNSKKRIGFRFLLGFAKVIFEGEILVQSGSAMRRFTVHPLVVWSVTTVLLAVGLVFLGPSPASAASCGSGVAYGAAGSDGKISIDNAQQLIYLSKTPADWDKSFIQTADLDLANCAWTPIGNATNKFTGTYDGGGYKVTRLDLRPAAANGGFGLFGAIGGATIKDLLVRGVIVALQGDHGGVVGRSYGTSTLLRVRSEVDITHSGYITSGGLVGSYFDGSLTVSQSSYAGTVFLDVSSGSAGGIIGVSSNTSVTITDSYSRVMFAGTNRTLTAARAGLIAALTPTAVRTYTVAPGALSGVSSSGLTSSSEGSFWDSEVGPAISRSTGAAVPGTTAKTTNQMKNLATYTTTVPSPSKELPTAWAIVQGWEAYNFGSPSNIWGICSGVNDGYPFHLWEFASNPCSEPAPDTDSGSAPSPQASGPVVKELAATGLPQRGALGVLGAATLMFLLGVAVVVARRPAQISANRRG